MKKLLLGAMAPVAEHLAGLLGQKVTLVEDWKLGVELNDGEVALLGAEAIRQESGRQRGGVAFHGKRLRAARSGGRPVLAVA